MADEPSRGKQRERRLTEKQEAFARFYVETSNASEAYRRAYDVKTMSQEAIAVEACNLLKDPRVSLMVDGLKEEHRKRHAVTVDSLTEMLKDDRELARQEGKADAAINAVLAMAKLHGLVVDRKNVTSDNRHTHAAEPLSPFADFLTGAIGAGAKGEAEGPLQN